MEFYRLKEIPPPAKGDVTFRYPARSGVFLFPLTAVVVGLLVAGPGPLAPMAEAMSPLMRAGYGAAAVLALIGTVRTWTGPGRRVRWLARVTGDRLMVRFRPPRNHRGLSGEDVVAVGIPWSAIAWACPAGGAGAKGRSTHVELKLRGADLVPLRMHLANERARKPHKPRHWWGGRVRLSRRHPVQLMPDDVLRLEWRVVPGIKRAVELLRDHLDPAPPPPGGAPAVAPEALHRIVSMARSGEMLGAFMEAAQVFGVDEPEAERLVEGLVTGHVSADDPKAVTSFLVKPIPRALLLDLAGRGDVVAVRQALVRDHRFSPAQALALGDALADLPSDQARAHLEAALDQGPPTSHAA